MAIKIRDGIIWSEDGRVIAIMAEGITEQDEKDLIIGSKLVPAAKKFVEKANSGSFKPRSTVKEFENILNSF